MTDAVALNENVILTKLVVKCSEIFGINAVRVGVDNGDEEFAVAKKAGGEKNKMEKLRKKCKNIEIL